MKKLSSRARKLLARIRNGEWYPALDGNSPIAMRELEETGLIIMCGRVKSLQLCWVPKGTKPPIMERLPK